MCLTVRDSYCLGVTDKKVWHRNERDTMSSNIALEHFGISVRYVRTKRKAEVSFGFTYPDTNGNKTRELCAAASAAFPEQLSTCY